MPTHRRRTQLFSIIVILTMLFSGLPPASAQGPDGIERQVNIQTGKVSFIGPENGQVLAARDALDTSIRPQDPAMALAKRFGPEFGLKDAERNLTEIRTSQADTGRITTRYQQTYQGIPVMGGELIVNTNNNGDLYSINGEVASALSLSIQPTVASEQAREIALQAVAEWYEKTIEDLIASEPELWIYEESLLRPSTRPAELVWRMDVTIIDNSLPVRELVLINAQRGSISLHFNQIDTAWTVNGSSGTVQDPEPTPSPSPTEISRSTETPVLTETPIPTETSIPTETVEATATLIPTEAPVSTDAPADVAAFDGATWYVSTTGNNSNSCSAPASPCLTMDGAIAKAATGDIIRVTSGTYTNTTGNVVIISKGMTLSGGWNDTFTVQNGASIIDGGGVRNGMLANAAGSTVLVENFVIQNSYTGSDSGGIYIYGANFTLKNSSVINNNAGGRGAGIFLIANGSLTVLNSTISGNDVGSSGGGIYVVNGTVTINNSTIAYNTSNGTGGGITREGGTISIKNSILAKNTAPGNGPDCSGSISSSDHNIVGNTGGCTVTNGVGDKFNVDPLIEDSLSGTLPLHALQADSPAINAGDNSTCLTIDQRGLSRPHGSACDIGAYEYTTTSELVAVSGSNQTAKPSSSFALPLTVYLVDSSANPVSGVTITFIAPASGASGTFADSETNVTTAVTDSEGYASSAIFMANNQLGTYTVSVTADGYDLSAGFSLKNLIANYYVAPTGSDSNSCDLPASPCLTINGAIAKAPPGNMIAVASGTYTGLGTEVVLISKAVTLSGGWDSTFSAQNGTSIIDGQSARRVIVNTATDVFIENFIIQGGFHTTMGAGVYNTSTLTLIASEVRNSVSQSIAGGIYNTGTLTLTNSNVHDNRSQSAGGGIQNYITGTLILRHSEVSGNVSQSTGGGIENFGALTIDNTFIGNNRANSTAFGGAAIHIFNGTVIMNNSTVSGNKGVNAIYNVSTLTLKNSTVSHNEKLGINNSSTGTVVLQNSILANNSTSASGQDCAGVITSSGYNLIRTVTGCTFVSSTGDQTGVDPLLSTYVVGTPSYHVLSSGSPAIDHGNPATCLPADQRGMARSQGSACDIGAYEYVAPGEAASFGISGVSSQRTGVSLPFALPLLIYVVDDAGSPVSGVEVTFTAPDSGPSGIFVDSGTNITTVPTNSEGVAVSPIFTANSQWGVYKVVATVSGLPDSVNFSLTNAAWFVSPTGSNTNSCVMPTSPCQTINSAITKAAAGDAILVAIGTYAPAGISKSLVLSGGWDTTFSSQIGYSIIQGSPTSDGISTSGANVSISRFIIQNSNYGINHIGGTLSFDRGASINNKNGIYNQAGDVTFTNTTISSNSGSAIYNAAGTIRIRYTTITNNIGSYGIYSLNDGAYIEIGDSILAGNTNGDCFVRSTNMISTGYNIFGRSPICSSSPAPVPDPSDQVGVDPQLSVLFPIGYHPISATSPAIDHANPTTCPAIDQRGVTRPQGATCDIGAYEYLPAGTAASFGVVSGSNQRSGPSLPFSLPLKVYVIDASGGPVSGATVTFTAPASGPSGTFADTGTLTTTAVSSEGLATSPVFTANSQLGSYKVTATVAGLSGLVDFALMNAAWFVSPTGSNANSCALPTSPCLTIDGAIAKAAEGDVIMVAGGTYPPIRITKSLTLLGGWDTAFNSQTGYSTISGTKTSYGIIAIADKISISRFIVKNNKFGIYNGSSNLNFDQGASINNQNGLYNYDGNTTFTNTTISGNNAFDYAGSAISNVGGTVKIQYSTITNNIGDEAIHSQNGGSSIEIENSILAWNPAGDCFISGDGMFSHGHNIFGSSPVCEDAYAPVVIDPTDRVGVNPGLFSMFPDGYHPLLSNSPAIDAADPLDCPATDQRGATRPVGTSCDIGAAEHTPTGTTPQYVFAYQGSPQIIMTNSAASSRLIAVVFDENGNSVQGTLVTFTAPNHGASVIFTGTGTNTSTAVTDANGFATSPAFSANKLAGSYSVVASVNGADTPAGFSLSNSAIAVSPKLRTHTANNYVTLPGTFLCDQTKLNCTDGRDVHADAAHKYAFGTYGFYASQYNRESIDNAGMTIVSSVHFWWGYANAAWTGSQMIYGDGYGFSLADDVVAHELTHGVTQHESSLFYFYQSGAINESFSDLWGEYYDQTNGMGNDSMAVKWLMGEDVSGLGALRSFSNPPDYVDPDKMSSPNYYTGTSDNGGVHTNSGVNNKAVFLMVDGGSFNGKTVSPLGWEKTAAIYYEVNTNLLSSGADYSDLYYALQQACTNLIGQKGITSRDCSEVKDAVDAVEMNGQPVANYNTEAPYCGEGNAPDILFSDDLESGTGNWTFSNGAYTRWQLDSPYGPNAHSGAHSLYADDYPGWVTDASAQLVAIPIPANAYLHFGHAYDFDANSYAFFDGGVLEYSTDNGDTWLDAGSLIDFNGYKGTIYTGYQNPLQGRSAFVGASHGYISTRLNLANLAGDTVSFRWRMGLDQASYVWGWWVDDVNIYQCVPDATPPTVTSIARVGSEITSAPSVDFILTFSEPVMGVDVNDFRLDTTGTITGATIENVSGLNNIYAVTVNTGSGNGTLRLDVPGGASITDLPGNPLAGLPFVDGQFYTINKTTNVQIYIGSSPSPVGTYPMESGGSIRRSFTGVNSGPVRIQSSTEIPIMAAERVIYKVNGTPTSFSEMIALPANQLDTIYWLPWYNNKDLNTQLRIANVSATDANVQITIGGLDMGSFTLPAGKSTRKSFPGIDKGPVKIKSNVDIVAAERVIYNVNGVDTSYSEMMALPNSQLDTIYWLPWYNSKDLDTQLRIANVSGSTAMVHVSIGGTPVTGSPFTILAGKSVRKSFPGHDRGPVKIESNVEIVAAERVIYKVNNVPVSFSETMALPNSQLDNMYWLPWYNNKDLNTQLRIANVSLSEATVHVRIRGVEVTGSPFTILAGGSKRLSFPGIDKGPVQIESNANIVASERVIYTVNGKPTSFSEMMGLPNHVLDTSYWLPWYNNVELDTQLRFGRP